MIKQIFSTVSLVLMLSAVAYPQNASGNAPIKDFSTHNIGFGGGFVTGYGLSYRHWFANQWGVQGTLAPFFNNTSDDHWQMYSIGATALKIFVTGKYVNLFGYLGPHFHYYSSQYKPYNYPNSGVENGWSFQESTNLYVGGGPGLDFHFWKISFNLMAGIAYHSDLEESSGMQLTGEGALYYSF